MFYGNGGDRRDGDGNGHGEKLWRYAEIWEELLGLGVIDDRMK
jgi:hypothetical protein